MSWNEPDEEGADGRGSGSRETDDAGPNEDLPEWDDEYLDRVAHDLKFNYDLERDYRVRGERFPLYGRLVMETYKQFLHPSINYANHAMQEYLFAARVGHVTTDDLSRYVDLGHALADEWVEANEEHQSTDFTFVLVAEEVPADVREFVSGFRDRNLLRWGYYGHYEVNLVVVAPDVEDHVASRNADVWRAFAPWADAQESGRGGLFGRLSSLFGR